MNLVERWPQAVMNTYGTPKVALVRGEGGVVGVEPDVDRQPYDLGHDAGDDELGRERPHRPIVARPREGRSSRKTFERSSGR